ncbi:uncharacterized protein NDAI_0A08590 [Naumovozyma dairenensis CBS 421]|uniref:Uncharacterized protein n=1 Tax=Naumovozyma dairenensis (strain ATCC 10597 / BCRC 20456 / CBS 421 / NBRC 0211 / NRRL Y-12639) TaxID=1071378 RepID=G0W5C4_NAUDC|nr:hypothetical protein NDAI_0A08590 [Naumovozyma dairenensis CBS 421]CCD23012.1 hypothetical protein NDAI_0A08590 [Naumovozyma dairenensis CBS 421]
MEVANNDKQKHLNLKVGDFILIHWEAYFNGGRCLKVQPIYVGPFKIVSTTNANVVEVDLLSSRKLHRTINVQKIGSYP